jgi:hypothetical protein
LASGVWNWHLHLSFWERCLGECERRLTLSKHWLVGVAFSVNQTGMAYALIQIADVQERERDRGVGLNDFFSTLLAKSHKDCEEWRDTGDLLNAAKLLQRAEEFISQQN